MHTKFYTFPQSSILDSHLCQTPRERWNVMEFRTVHRFPPVILLAGLLSITVVPARADSLTNTKVALHVTTPPAKAATICTTNRPEIPCSQYTTAGDAPGAFLVYLTTAQTSSTGINSLSCGIEYDPAPSQGVDVLQWYFCSDGVDYPSGGANGLWPASGGGNRMTWLTCQNTEVSPDGVQAIWGAFYVYAYGADDLRVTPNYNVGLEPELKAVLCGGQPVDLYPFGSTGQASFSAGATAPGVNPCLGISFPCLLSTGSLGFGVVPLGQSADRSFTLTNITNDIPGATPRDLIGTISIPCPEFQIVGDPSYNVAPGETATFTVRFTPAEPGTTRCRLDPGEDCPEIDLAGIGGASCLVDHIVLSYGVVPLGSSIDRSFTIRNSSPSGGPDLTGTVSLDCSDFEFVDGGGAYSLPPGESRIVTVRFTPTVSGYATCRVETGTSCGPVELRAGGGTPSTGTPVLALHVQAPPSKAALTCTSAAPTLPCSRYLTRAESGTGRYVYLVVAHGDPVSGVGGVSCGIDYDQDLGAGVDLISWILCADGLEFPNSGGNGPWPAAGGGNRITWLTCQHDEIPPDGVHAVVGAFYVYAYGEGDLSVTPNNNLLSGPELAIVNCFSALQLVPSADVGRVAFSPGALRAGKNPCVDAVEAADFAINPQSLNAAAGGRWMTAYLELPPEFNPGDVDLESVRLQGSIPADPGFFGSPEGDFNHNKIPDLMFKFDRADFIESLPAEGDEVTAVVTGMLAGPVPFVASAPVHVVRPHMISPNGGESFPAGILLSLTWDVPAGWEDASASLSYTTDDGGLWTSITEDATGGRFIWRIPTEPVEAVSVRVEVRDDFGLLGRDVTDGSFTVSEAVGIGETPVRTALLANAPNPFSAATRIRYDLAAEARVRMTVFNVQGQRVRVLVDEMVPAGSHEARWDGRDDAGKPVASGLYLVDFRAGTYQQTRRMLLTR